MHLFLEKTHEDFTFESGQVVAGDGRRPSVIATTQSLEECIDHAQSVPNLTAVDYGSDTYSSFGVSDKGKTCWVFSDYRHLAIDKSANDSVSSFIAGKMTMLIFY